MPFGGGMTRLPSASIIHELQGGGIIGTGPWKLKEWIHDGHILFERNNNYFDGPPKLESLKINFGL